MAQNEQKPDEQAVQELRDTISRHGWKATAELVADVIEFVVDLCHAGHPSPREIQDFSHGMQVTINTLWELGDGSYKEEVHRLREAIQSFNCARAARCDVPLDGCECWSVFQAQRWCEYLNEMRRFYKESCESWRHHFGPAREHRVSALKCIEEIETRISVLRPVRLAGVAAQRAALAQLLLLTAQLTVYADHTGPLYRCSKFIAPATDESDPRARMTAFCRTIIGDNLRGPEHWLREIDPLKWVKAETNRLMSLYDDDGRLDSHERIIHERAFIDPLYDEAEDIAAFGTVDKYSIEVTQHPTVQMEIENLEVAFKEAGVNPAQRKALVLRSKGKIMSRRDLKEWKRSQRGISRSRSKLIKVITAATKKRVIKAPLISGGSNTGVIREGAGYTFSFLDDRQLSHHSPASEPEARWFDSTPPPISRSDRKPQHLFKKVST